MPFPNPGTNVEGEKDEDDGNSRLFAVQQPLATQLTGWGIHHKCSAAAIPFKTFETLSNLDFW